jgi:tRNA1(Val) A37 N6-methylase TrmN6
MDASDLEGWFRFMARMAAPGGLISIIHRADALAVLLAGVSPRFGGVRILPLHPRAGEAAHRVIVTARKGSRAPLELLPGMVLHGPGNAFLPEIAAVLRDGAPLTMLAGEASMPL